ncbi:MAG: hypothetical protein BV458_06085 [Thermoplasmata archaeon M9B2D]|nr:MAG: hypothetical protein BV458_06085 [Thermoplasmata archaeon M9B2D]
MNQDVSETPNTKKNSRTDGLRLQKVKTLQDLKVFYQVPFHLYQDNLYWVAPFWREIHGFFKKNNVFWSHAEAELFILWDHETAVGRIAAIIDHAYCETMEKQIGFFGFFECINDYTAASVLFQAAEDWLVCKGMRIIQGPIDGRIDMGCGFLYDGFDVRPTILSTYTPAYYISHAERFGLRKSRDLFSYHIDLTAPLPKHLEEKSRQCIVQGVQVRRFNRLRSRRELSWWVDLFLQTFSGHWGFVPVSKEEVRTRFGVKQIRWFVDSSLFLVAEWNRQPVAYLWATPDYNQVFQKMHGQLGPFQLLRFLLTKKTINTGKLHLIGIKGEFRNKNIGSLLNYQVLVEMKNRGYVGAEVGWIDEQNTAAHITIALTEARLSKKHRVFEKDLAENVAQKDGRREKPID